MIKYDLVVYKNDVDIFLSQLQDLGASHIETSPMNVDTQTMQILKQAERFQSVANLMRTVEQKPAAGHDIPHADPPQLVETYESLLEKRSTLDATIKKLEKDISEARPWGTFDIQDINRLAQLGCAPRFYTDAEKHFDDALRHDSLVCELNRCDGKVYFAVIQPDSDLPSLDLPEAHPPLASCQQLEAELKQLEANRSECQDEIQHLAGAADLIDAARKQLIEQADFNIARQSAADAADGYIKLLTAWVPQPQSAAIESLLDSSPALWIASRKNTDETPPVLLRNNKFAKLFEPITKLYSLPHYRELDLTPMLAPFFMLFFGFCLGDGGYGLFILIVSSILKLKLKRSSLRPYLSLAQWLGAGTMLFGFITATFFGITLNDIKPDKIIEQRLGLQENYGMLYFSLLLGCIQIIAGMSINIANIVRTKGWKHAASNIAWIIMLLGGAAWYFAGAQMGRALFALYALLALAALTALFYNAPDKDPLSNLGSGLWITYNTVSGLLGDLLSYIRLFALGMTGGILGGVFNSIALDAGKGVGIPVVDILVTLLILLFGHALNLTLNMLGAFVHPMRLTFVEFYKNAGFSGGGKPFKPFARAVSK